MSADNMIEEAFAECQRLYIKPAIGTRCERPEYLEARRRYHALLVAAGMLHPSLAELT